MNFKLLIALFFYTFSLAIIASCGVKTVPLKPTETVIDSYIESYTHETEQTKKKNIPPDPTASEKK